MRCGLKTSRLFVGLGGRQFSTTSASPIAPGELHRADRLQRCRQDHAVPGDPRPVAPRAGRVAGRRGRIDRRNPSIGYVPQKIALDPDMPLRARDLVGLGLDGHRFGIPRPRANARARSTRCSRRSTPPLRRRPGREPVRRRAAAGHDRPRPHQPPGLLLLDEPLANLDITQRPRGRRAAGPDRRASSGSPCSSPPTT